MFYCINDNQTSTKRFCSPLSNAENTFRENTSVRPLILHFFVMHNYLSVIFGVKII